MENEIKFQYEPFFDIRPFSVAYLDGLKEGLRPITHEKRSFLQA